ncbi:MAG: T9SS type A sorting domain-containing protein [Saprospiraceae bacterium]
MKKTIFTHSGWKSCLYLVAALPFFLLLSPQRAGAQACVMACQDQINISVGADCQALVGVATFVTLPTNICLLQAGLPVQITMWGPNGVPIVAVGNALLPFFTIPASLVGTTCTYEVKQLNINGPDNRCWGFAKVEDKMAPAFVCLSETVPCYLAIARTNPNLIAIDNCEGPTFVLTSVIQEIPLNCDPDYIKRLIIRHITADSKGNRDTCFDDILVERFDTADLTWPLSRSMSLGNPLLCTGDTWDLNGNGYPDPAEVGYPTVGNPPVNLIPGQTDACNIDVSFTDTETVKNCVRKIMRRWTITEWYCNDDIETSFVQILEIRDTDAPLIVCPIIQNGTTLQNLCIGNVFLPYPQVSDPCGSALTVDVSWPGGGQPNLKISGTTAQLPVGEHIITYIVRDLCGNSSICSSTAIVQDKTSPVAVCDQHTIVALSNDGTARVFALTFDDGSHDECGIFSYKVARMNAGCNQQAMVFGPYVDFCCSDIVNSPITVILRVTDKSGNTNDCMVLVSVQDKLPPVIVCPPDVVLPCTFDFDPNNPAQYGVFGKVVANDQNLRDSIWLPQFAGFDLSGNPIYVNTFIGLDGIAFDNCNVTITVINVVDINNCGVGTIRRTFTASDPSTTFATCTQTISFVNYDPFNGDIDIVWPLDTSIVGACNLQDLDPDNLPVGYNKPTWSDDECDLIGVGYDDWVFTINEIGACKKILRKWKVIDWCQYNPEQPGVYAIWTHDQILKVNDNVKPTFNVPTNVSVCSYDLTCDENVVGLFINNVMDNCSNFGELYVKAEVDINNDGVIDFPVAVTKIPGVGPLGNRVKAAEGPYMVGTHRIYFTVEDLCGNKTTMSYLFTVANCKAPAVIVFHGLAAELMPMDLNGDGIPDDGMVRICARQYNNASSPACGGVLRFSFSSDVNDTCRILTCADLIADSDDIIDLNIWATDSYGNQDFTSTYVYLQDNQGICVGNTLAMIAGKVVTEDSKDVELVNVNLQGATGAPSNTGTDGAYSFNYAYKGKNYTVVPAKDLQAGNGVSTHDLILIQKHILGIKPLSSPYKIIAADANNDKKVTSADLISIRKVILKKEDNFINNTSWRFVDKSYQFNNPTKPLDENFKEVYTINGLNGSMMDINFTGVKIGDVNNSVNPTNATNVDTRGAGQPFAMLVDDQYIKAGDAFQVTFRAGENTSLYGYQFTLGFDAAKMTLAGVNPNAANVDDANFNFNKMDEGQISTSWNADQAITVTEGEALFTVQFTATQDMQLSDVLSINSKMTTAEAYRGDLEINPVTLDFRGNAVSTTDYALFQNKPNPFADFTLVSFNLPASMQASLKVYDLSGRMLKNVESTFHKGYNEVRIDRSELSANGVLYYTLETADYTATKKMIILE